MELKQLPKHAGEHLLEIIMRRYENKSTIMTSNRPTEDWGQIAPGRAHRVRDPRPLPAPRDDHLHYRPELPPQDAVTNRQKAKPGAG